MATEATAALSYQGIQHAGQGRHGTVPSRSIADATGRKYLGRCGARGHPSKGRRPTLAHLGHARSWTTHARPRARAIYAGRSTARHQHAGRTTHAGGPHGGTSSWGHPLRGGLHEHAWGRPSHGPSRPHALRGASPKGRPPPWGRHSAPWLPRGASHELRGHAAWWASHAWPRAGHAHGPWPGSHEAARAHRALRLLHAARPHAAWRTLQCNDQSTGPATSD